MNETVRMEVVHVEGIFTGRMPEEDWTFVWEGYEGWKGGEYIEVFREDSLAEAFAAFNTTAPGRAATDGEARIDFTEENFRREVQDWYDANAEWYR